VATALSFPTLNRGLAAIDELGLRSTPGCGRDDCLLDELRQRLAFTQDCLDFGPNLGLDTDASRRVLPFIIKICPRLFERLPFIMDKFLLQQQVLERLAENLLQAEQAVRAAHETATHEENIAENKYDTLGLEAAYLATGQARRAEAIRQAMAHWRQFRPRPYDASKGIELGALVCLVDSHDKQQQIFLGPDGGSMTLVSGAQRVQVISSEAPLGRAMLGKCEGDEVSIQVAPIRQQFEVLRVH
jgi:transcription elongation GreA/GreB family factor